MTNSLTQIPIENIGKKPISELRSSKLRLLVEFWNRIRGERAIPDRADFSPEDLTWILPDLAIVDVLSDPRRYLYRLCGSELSLRIGEDLTGKYLDDTRDPRVIETISRTYDEVVATARPLATERSEFLGRFFLNYESVTLPFSRRDGELDMLMIGIDVAPQSDGDYQIMRAQVTEAADDIEDARLKDLFGLWTAAKVGKNLPTEEFIDPFRLKPLLGNIVVVGVHDVEPKFRYRLIGTNIVRVMGVDLTGKSIGDHPIKSMSISYRNGLEMCSVRRAPIYAKLFRPFTMADGTRKFIASELLALPLVAPDQRVSRILAGQVYEMSPSYL